MVWGAIAKSGVGSLHFMGGTLNSERYIEIGDLYVKEMAENSLAVDLSSSKTKVCVIHLEK